MGVLRIIAWVLILGAVFVAGQEFVDWITHGIYHVRSSGEVWDGFNQSSHIAFLGWGQSHLPGWLMESVFQPLLLMPAWVVLGVPGMMLRLLMLIRPTPSESR